MVALLPLLLACKGYDFSGPSRCQGSDTKIDCPYETLELAGRDVHWQQPLGEPPAAGWPVAVLFQGSLAPAELFWFALRGEPMGGYHQARLTKALLDEGYLVLTPEAQGEGLTCWNTNLPQWADDWQDSPDAELMEALFAALDAGDFGPVDPDHVVAAGISSGGYMTSRMATAYPERFAALAIASASWQSCAGVVCDVPDELPADHPPTLFLHGAMDLVVPVWTMQPYRDRLEVPADSVVDELTGHGWLHDAPELILDWFAEWG